MNACCVETEWGTFGVGERDGRIVRIWLPNQVDDASCDGVSTPLLDVATAQLREYLAGTRTAFDLPIGIEGTAFTRAVYDALCSIPYGETRTYAEVAATVGRPRAYRAVGMVNHHNPLPILIPCHRVIGSGGALTGYAGGVELKAVLLALEAQYR